MDSKTENIDHTAGAIDSNVNNTQRKFSGDKNGRRIYTSSWDDGDGNGKREINNRAEKFAILDKSSYNSEVAPEISDQTSSRRPSPEYKTPRQIYLEQQREALKDEKLWFLWKDGKKNGKQLKPTSTSNSKMENNLNGDIKDINYEKNTEKVGNGSTSTGQSSDGEKSPRRMKPSLDERRKEQALKEKEWYLWNENPASKRALKNNLDEENLPERYGGTSPRRSSQSKEKFDKHWSVWNLHKEKSMEPKPSAWKSEPAGIKYQEMNKTSPRMKYQDGGKGHWAVWKNGNKNQEDQSGTDYIQHPMEKPWVRQPEQYMKPQGNMDTTTSYKKDYTEKYGAPSRPIKHDGMKQVPGKFEGEPTYKSDYKQWDMSGRTGPFVSQDAWVPPNSKFEGQSTMHHDYRKYHQAPRQPMKPMEAARMSDVPFDNSTGYRDSYIKHQMPPKFLREQEQYKAPTARFEDTTTFKRDYRGQPGARMESFRPNNQAFQSDHPLDDVTTNRNDYRKWPLERPYVHQQEAYHRPEGEMESSTTHKMTYREHPLQRNRQVRPSSSTKLRDAKFEGITNYSQDYKKWDGTNRPRPMVREDYVPTNAPFEGMSTQKAHYIPHDIQPHRSFKPDTGAFLSNADFDGTTMYRVDYTPKKVEVCPAGLLDGPTTSYSFVNVDNRGHKQYTPVIETVSRLPNGKQQMAMA